MSETPREKNWEVGSNEKVKPRGLRDYEVALGINREDLRGKKILDLGASKQELFSKELKENEIECEVTSLSPDFALEQHREIIEKRNSVAAIAQKLPFTDEAFDYIFDVGGPGIYVKRLGEWVPETMRTLKKNGTMIIVVSKLDIVNFIRLNTKLLLEGHEARLEKISDEVDMPFAREVIVKK